MCNVWGLIWMAFLANIQERIKEAFVWCMLVTLPDAPPPLPSATQSAICSSMVLFAATYAIRSNLPCHGLHVFVIFDDMRVAGEPAVLVSTPPMTGWALLATMISSGSVQLSVTALCDRIVWPECDVQLGLAASSSKIAHPFGFMGMFCH